MKCVDSSMPTESNSKISEVFQEESDLMILKSERDISITTAIKSQMSISFINGNKQMISKNNTQKESSSKPAPSQSSWTKSSSSSNSTRKNDHLSSLAYHKSLFGSSNKIYGKINIIYWTYCDSFPSKHFFTQLFQHYFQLHFVHLSLRDDMLLLRYVNDFDFELFCPSVLRTRFSSKGLSL